MALAVWRKLDKMHLEHPFMGSRMLRRQVTRQGLHAGGRHIGTVMLRRGVEAWAHSQARAHSQEREKLRRGTRSIPTSRASFAIGRAHQVWALDTTYLLISRGFVYFTTVVDVARRKLLAHKVGHYVGSHVRQ